MSRDYKRLPIEEFGKILIQSNDLDPVYVALYTMHSGDILSVEQLNRWVLAYICFYHCGLASFLSEFEGDKFFEAMMVAAKNEESAPTGGRYPRGHERRHFRGQQAIAAVEALHSQYGPKPEDCLRYISWGGEEPHRGSVPFRDISRRALEHRSIGSWAAFKIADMVDRLGLRKVEFSFDEVVVYESPLKAAEELVRLRLNLPKEAQVKLSAVREVFEYLEQYFSEYSAPPLHDRSIGLQECESVLCKHASHLHGHYPIYNDLLEIHSGLSSWVNVSEVASFFKAAMPKVPAEAVI